MSERMAPSLSYCANASTSYTEPNLSWMLAQGSCSMLSLSSLMGLQASPPWTRPILMKYIFKEDASLNLFRGRQHRTHVFLVPSN